MLARYDLEGCHLSAHSSWDNYSVLDSYFLAYRAVIINLASSSDVYSSEQFFCYFAKVEEEADAGLQAEASLGFPLNLY